MWRLVHLVYLPVIFGSSLIPPSSYTVTQSSLYGTGVNFPPQNAIDGDNGTWSQTSCLKDSGEPWLRVQLHCETKIDKIVILNGNWNSVPKNYHRLNNSHVEVVFYGVDLVRTVCGTIITSDGNNVIDQTYTVSCHNFIGKQFVF